MGLSCIGRQVFNTPLTVAYYIVSIFFYLSSVGLIPLILAVQDAWHDFVRPIDIAMIERRGSRGHEVHAIRDSTRASILS